MYKVRLAGSLHFHQRDANPTVRGACRRYLPGISGIHTADAIRTILNII